MYSWTFAIAAIPLFASLAFHYIVVSPWHCRVICCFNEASCTKVSVEGSYVTKYVSVVEELERSLTVGKSMRMDVSLYQLDYRAFLL